MARVESPSESQAAIKSSIRAVFAIFSRDVFVTGRQLPIFLAQVLLQPVFFLFIFGRILPDLGFASGSYASVLFPGIIVLTIVLTSLQSTALPLVIEFGWTKEIEDRLLAPLPVDWVAVQKMLIASGRGLIAGLVIFPLGALIVGPDVVGLTAANLGPVLFYSVMAAFVGSAIGLSLGTLVEPSQVQLMFALILTPMFFTGATQYPWVMLSRLKWFQILTLANPMTYASEGMRAALVPAVPHMNPLAAAVALGASILFFGCLGIWGFRRRSID